MFERSEGIVTSNDGLNAEFRDLLIAESLCKPNKEKKNTIKSHVN